jgi:hypothetical protein
VAFQLAQVLHQYGLKPSFNNKLEEWLSDLYHIVQLLSKKQQSKNDLDRADLVLTSYLTPTKPSTGVLLVGLNSAQNLLSKG